MNTVGTLADPALWHRIQFAFTITYHYLFPQLTMGLAWLPGSSLNPIYRIRLDHSPNKAAESSSPIYERANN